MELYFTNAGHYMDFAIYADFITSVGKDRKGRGGGRSWKRQGDDAVIRA